MPHDLSVETCYFCGVQDRKWLFYDLFGQYPVCLICRERIANLFKDKIEAELEEEHET